MLTEEDIESLLAGRDIFSSYPACEEDECGDLQPLLNAGLGGKPL